MDNNRLAAFEALLKVEQEGAWSNLAVGNAIREVHPDNEAFVRNLVYGVLQQKILIDYQLDGLVKSGVRKVKARARILLRMGIYQIEFMDSVPDYAAVSETVRLSRKKCPGLSGLINGVLRSYLREPAKRDLPGRKNNPAEYLSVKYSCSRELAELWLNRFGTDRTESLLSVGNEAPPLTICVNSLKTTPDVLSGVLAAKGFTVRVPDTTVMPVEQAKAVKAHALYVSGNGIMDTEEFHEGLFTVQDISSMRAVAALSPQPGQRILDICAAPGGKSIFTALLMKDRGEILSGDIYEHKLRLIDQSVERLGIHVVKTKMQDASAFEEELMESADAVIADVPCSGLGVIRRRPEIKWKMTGETIRELVLVQRGILENASRYVRKNGKLLYSTCTISREENEEMTARFMRTHPDFSKVTEQQLFPDTDHSDGFYFCVMKRR